MTNSEKYKMNDQSDGTVFWSGREATATLRALFS